MPGKREKWRETKQTKWESGAYCLSVGYLSVCLCVFVCVFAFIF
ncbi:chaperone DNAJ protein, putative, partial [Trypanosoma cruzi]